VFFGGGGESVMRELVEALVENNEDGDVEIGGINGDKEM
jgi:hypothetical protein